MKVLITGAAGFIGSHLATYCWKQGHTVLALDSKWPRPYTKSFLVNSNGTEQKDSSRMKIFEYNVANQPITIEREVFEEFKPDVCYHLAAYASEGRSNHIRSFIHYNNTVGTANVINACVNYKCKLVFTSSVAVYSGLPPFDENTNPNPIDEYGLSKYMSERSIVIAGDKQGLDFCIIRPRNVYGPGQNIFDRSRNLFGIWCYNALNDLPLQIYGDGHQSRCFTYIDDLIPCLFRAKDVSGEIINLGANDSWMVADAAVVFSESSGYKNIQHVDSRHEVKEAFCRIDKQIKLLGWGPKETYLTDGLKKMWAWAKTVPMRPLDQMPPLEVTINAHSSLK